MCKCWILGRRRVEEREEGKEVGREERECGDEKEQGWRDSGRGRESTTQRDSWWERLDRTSTADALEKNTGE